MYYIFSHTDPYEHVGNKQKKKRKLKIYTLQTHTQLHTDKKKERNTP